jgi:hypothetical protein
LNTTSRLIVLTLIVCLFVILFSGAIFGGGMFAYRDAAHFYYPLFQFERDEWAAGRVPLWNPYENLGQPLAADASSSVFYPGKLIFALPLDYAWAYKIYILGHVLLAAALAYRAARHFKASVAAAGICAISYAFSGNVLFDYCNVVFLVGAAWLPAAIIAADHMLRQRSPCWVAALGMVLAMMVLGGDPQMAYSAGLLAALYAVILWLHEASGPLSLWERVRVRASECVKVVSHVFNRRRSNSRSCINGNDIAKTDGPHPSPLPAGEGTNDNSPNPNALPRGEGTKTSRLLKSRLMLLVMSFVLGFLLSAVQVLISIELTSRSDRVPDALADRFLGRLPVDTHQEYTYHFSVGPWRLAEYLWPNCSGRQFPIHRHWLDALPVEGRPWSPSLYMGVLPLLLALAAARFRRGGPLEKWLSWSVLLSTLASFGWFAPGWLLQELYTALGGAPENWPLGAPFGGVYWLLTLLLPGYAYFRYPAKLLVVAAMGMSLLAARGWDAVFRNYFKRQNYSPLSLRERVRVRADTSETRDLIVQSPLPSPPTPLPKGEGMELESPHPSPLRAPTEGWSGEGTDGRLLRRLAWLGLASLVGALAALAIGPFWDGWLVGAENDSLFGPLDKSGAYYDLLGSLLQTAAICGICWGLFSKRLIAKPQAATVLMLILIASDLAVANEWMVVCAPADLWEQTPAATAPIAQIIASQSTAPCRVYRHPFLTPPIWATSSSSDRLAESVRWQRETLFPKYNLTHGIALTEVQGTMSLRDYEEYLAQTSSEQSPWQAERAEFAILPPGRVLRGGEPLQWNVPDATLWRVGQPLSRVWIVHKSEKGTVPFSSDENWDNLPDESCRVEYYDPLRVEVKATLTKPGTVVLREQFYPGWRLEVDGKDEPILQIDNVIRGAAVSGGEHHLVYRYEPALFRVGAAISILSWLGLLVCGLVWRLREYYSKHR